jgi:uncharacterized protein
MDMAQPNPHAIAWFEIPARDFDRAVAFYEQAFETTLHRENFGGGTMAIFPHPDGAIGGCIFASPELEPTAGGVRIYLNAGPSLSARIASVERAGGKRVTEIIELPDDIGYIASFDDPEGNRIALHAIAR